MGMEFNLNKIAYILFLFTIFSCNKNKKDEIIGDVPIKKKLVKDSLESKIEITDTTYVNGFYLELLNKNQKTELNVIKGEDTIHVKNIDINPPSYFLRNSNKKVESYSYPDINVKETIIIVGDIIKNQKIEDLPNYDGICGNMMQAILFQNETILPSKTRISGTPVCIDISVDEKVYWGFAHD